MDYQKFRKDFAQSGLTQKAYGEQISMSSSMVHYYLGKTRLPSVVGTGFSELSVQTKSSDREIRITTAEGIEICIPI
jgi:hypothetical protein